AETHRRPRIPPPGTPTAALTDPETARAWLDTERPTLVAVAAYTATHGWPTHTTRLSTTLFRYLAAGHFADALTVHGHAQAAAHHTAAHTIAVDSGAPVQQARAHTGLGHAYRALDDPARARRHYQQAL